MRGKVARHLRKIAEFDPRSKREYRTYTLVKKVRVPVIDEVDGKYRIVDTALQDVNREITECVSGSRKVYQITKKMFYNPEFEARLTKLPTKEEEEKLATEIRHQEELNGKSDTKEMGRSEETL